MWSNHPQLVGLPSQWFKEVRCGRTTPNSLQPTLNPLHHSGSLRFGLVEPPQTHWYLPCRPASPFIPEVWCGRTTPNSFETAL